MADQAYRILYPYCLKKQADGKYAILNREYLPIGFMPRPEALPNVSYEMDITPDLAKQLSVNGSEDTDSIYLYNDATQPMNGGTSLDAYMERLIVLLGLKVW